MQKEDIVLFIAVLVFRLTTCGQKVNDKDGTTYVQDISYDTPYWDIIEDANDVDIVYQRTVDLNLPSALRKTVRPSMSQTYWDHSPQTVTATFARI